MGGLFLGYLSEKGKDVTGIVRDYQKDLFNLEGIHLSGARGAKTIKVKADTNLSEDIDLAIFATKTADLKPLIEANLKHLEKAIILTTQNGVRADYIFADYFPQERIVSGIVMFGSTFYAPNEVVHNFEGNLIVGNIFDKEVEDFNKVIDFLTPAFKITELKNIRGAKYLKLLINLNNCIPACLGVSMQEAFADIEISKLAIKLNREAYSVLKESGIELASLPNYPKERIEGLVSMDIEEAGGIFSKVMSTLSREPLYGSILQSIKRNKLSEIDYINGEIIKIASDNKLEARLNSKMVDLVHRIEENKKFLSKKELLEKMEA